MDKDVFVFGEHERGELSAVTLELLTEGKKLARRLQSKLVCIMLGPGTSSFCKTLGHYGADMVLVAEEAFLESYSVRAFVSVLSKVVHSHQPWIFLFSTTPRGRELAPALATNLERGLVTDCNILDIDGVDRLVMTKFVYGGQASAEIVCADAGVQMATVQAGAVDIDDPDYSRNAILGEVDIGAQPLSSFDAKVVDFVKGDPKEIDISEAEIIVAGGRGMESKGSFNLIEEMADLIGGSVAGSRVAADKGWMPYSRQVGLSGKTTTPEVFIACGISGAVQFQAGMKNSKHILAINKDRYAPIFGIADIKVLGDVHKILPLLVEKLKKAKKERGKQG